mmetsp:Transcript_116333/g.370130  ORF Transcript_116333/g.370130 Transcript_116333/m.370130 type:complete len:103 (-) Transcript_116333:797-1105(-)
MIMQQERFFHQSAETIVEVPGLLVQEESVLVPKIVVQRRVQQQSFEMIVEVPVPLSQVEIERVFTIIRLPHHHHSRRAGSGGACAYDSRRDRTRAEGHPTSA